MDLLTHALWTGAGVVWLRRHPSTRAAVPPAMAVGALAMAVVPDLWQGVPVIAWALAGGHGLGPVLAFATALPGQEPVLPPSVGLLSHHLHCIAHSAPVAALAGLAAWRWARALWPLLAAWWLHIVIDVFTHSAAFYPVPVLYPFSDRGFDGIAWNTPWFVAVNHGALILVWGALALTRRRR